MKKLFSFVATVALALGFTTACEDVPAPYGLPTDPIVNPETNGDVFVDEPFTTTLGSFTNHTTSGAGEWKIDFKTAKAAGYDNKTKVTTAGTYYLVSKEVDLKDVKEASIAFDYILRYNKGAENQQLLITDNFTGDAAKASWTLINQQWTEGSDWTTFTSYAVNVPQEFMGKKVRVALKYNTDDKSGSTWEVKNFIFKKGAVKADTPSTPDAPAGTYLNETFATSLGGFTNVTTSGAGTWIIDFKTAKATGFDSKTKKTTAGTYYLVSQEFDLAQSKGAHVAFDYIIAYNKAAENQQLLITTSYNADKASEGWEVLNQTWKPENKKADGKIDWNNFNKADIDIPAKFLGKKVRIAFRYNTDDKSGSTWELKNLVVAEGKAAAGSVTPEQPQQPEQPQGGTLIDETFATSLGSFTNVTTAGTGAWVIDFKTAKATGYDSKTRKTTASTFYLVSQEVDLKGATAAKMVFDYIVAYNKGDENQQLLITTSYNADKASEGWEVLNQTWNPENKKADGKIDWNKFHTAEIAIPAKFLGKKVRIAFRYNSDNKSGSTWEIKNFKLTK